MEENYREPFEEIFSAKPIQAKKWDFKRNRSKAFFLVLALHITGRKDCGRNRKCGAIDRFIFEWCIIREA